MRRNHIVLAVLLLAAMSAAAQTTKQFHYDVAPGSTVVVYNAYGPISIRPGSGRQVLVNATLASNKVEIDPTVAGNRVELRTHALQRVSDSDGKVQYEITVPPDISLNVRTLNGPIVAENLHGDLTLVDDAGSVDVRNCSGGHVHVQTIGGPVTLTNINHGHVEVTSVNGNVALNNVTGPLVSVNTNRGSIKYDGDAGENGDYSLTNNTGDIEFVAPASASLDMSARSMSGSVENDFPLQQKLHTSFLTQPGRAFTGTSNSGGSTVELRSFSGTIRVKKR